MKISTLINPPLWRITPNETAPHVNGLLSGIGSSVIDNIPKPIFDIVSEFIMS